MAKELKLTKKDRISVWLRSTFLQGSWNYERMQNGGWAFAMIPAIKRLYKTKEERSAALSVTWSSLIPTHMLLLQFLV